MECRLTANVAAAALLALSLLPAFDSLGAESGVINRGPDYIIYSGELEIRANPPPCTGGYYCDERYCAHGFGRVSGEREIYYTGTFVHGCPDGDGVYSTEFFTYAGSLKMGQIHGRGRMTCNLSLRSFEGEFVNDSLDGKPFDRRYGLCGEAE